MATLEAATCLGMHCCETEPSPGVSFNGSHVRWGRESSMHWLLKPQKGSVGSYLPVKIHELKDCSQAHNPFFLYFLLTPAGGFPEQSLLFDTVLQVQDVALLPKGNAAFCRPSVGVSFALLCPQYLLGSEWQTFPRVPRVWPLGPQVMELFGKVIDPIGGGALLEEAYHWAILSYGHWDPVAWSHCLYFFSASSSWVKYVWLALGCHRHDFTAVLTSIVMEP